MLRYMRPAGGGLTAVSLGTAGAYFVAFITAGHPLPWWPYILLLSLAVVGAIGYIAGSVDSELHRIDRTEKNRKPTAVQVSLPQPRRSSGTSRSSWDRNEMPHGHIKSFRFRRKVRYEKWVRGKVSAATRDAEPLILVHPIAFGFFQSNRLKLDSKGNFKTRVSFGVSWDSVGEEFIVLLAFVPQKFDFSYARDSLPEEVQILDQRRVLRI